MSTLTLDQISHLEAEGEASELEIREELQIDETDALMQTPPGPLKSSTRIHGRRRPRNGPFESSREDGGFG